MVLERPAWHLPLFSIVAGAFAGVIVEEIGQRWSAVAQTFWLLGIVGIAVFSAVVVVLESLCKFGRWRIVPLTLVGIAIGVAIYAGWEESHGGGSQNLWPVDIAFWWVVSFVPMTGAFFGARKLRRRLVSRNVRVD